MKGTVFGGIIHFPQHPDADMHGLVRACLRFSNPWILPRLWQAFGIDFDYFRNLKSGIWGSSKSHAEEIATETHYGELLVCPIVKAYLRAEEYRPIPKRLLVGKTKTA